MSYIFGFGKFKCMKMHDIIKSDKREEVLNYLQYLLKNFSYYDEKRKFNLKECDIEYFKATLKKYSKKITPDKLSFGMYKGEYIRDIVSKTSDKDPKQGLNYLKYIVQWDKLKEEEKKYIQTVIDDYESIEEVLEESPFKKN